MTDQPDRQDDKCGACGIKRCDHNYSGGAYGVCGRFVEVPTHDGAVGKGDREVVGLPKADAILSLPVQHGASEQEALQDIARQKTISEMIEDGNEIGDLEYAYNTMIARARNALSRQAPHSSSEAK